MHSFFNIVHLFSRLRPHLKQILFCVSYYLCSPITSARRCYLFRCRNQSLHPLAGKCEWGVGLMLELNSYLGVVSMCVVYVCPSCITMHLQCYYRACIFTIEQERSTERHRTERKSMEDSAMTIQISGSGSRFQKGYIYLFASCISLFFCTFSISLSLFFLIFTSHEIPVHCRAKQQAAPTTPVQNLLLSFTFHVQMRSQQSSNCVSPFWFPLPPYPAIAFSPSPPLSSNSPLILSHYVMALFLWMHQCLSMFIFLPYADLWASLSNIRSMI